MFHTHHDVNELEIDNQTTGYDCALQSGDGQMLTNSVGTQGCYIKRFAM